MTQVQTKCLLDPKPVPPRFFSFGGGGNAGCQTLTQVWCNFGRIVHKKRLKSSQTAENVFTCPTCDPKPRLQISTGARPLTPFLVGFGFPVSIIDYRNKKERVPTYSNLSTGGPGVGLEPPRRGALFGCFGGKLMASPGLWWFNHLPGKPIYCRSSSPPPQTKEERRQRGPRLVSSVPPAPKP